MWTLRRAWAPGHRDSTVKTLVLLSTVSHRFEKQRMLDNFIMENMLTATNTFHCEDGANNIYTCSSNGTHEPQQIDYLRLNGHEFGSLGTHGHHQISTCKGATKKKKKTGKPLDGNVGTV